MGTRALLLTAIALLICARSANGQAPDWLWAHPFVYPFSSAPGEGRAITVGPSGDAFVGGQVSATANFNGLISAGTGYDPFVGRVNADGQWQWVKRGTGYHYCMVLGVDAAANGDVLIGGPFNDTLRFGNTLLVDSPGIVEPGGFVARLNSDGDWLWAIDVVSHRTSPVNDVAFAPDGSVVLGGYYSDSLLIDGDTLIAEGFNNAFFGKLDANGNWLWHASTASPLEGNVIGVDVDAAGNIALCGTFRSSMMLGDTVLNAAQNPRGFLALLDPDGQLLWARTFVTAGQSAAMSVTFDEENNLYTTGYFDGADLAVGDSTFINTHPGFTDVWVAKFSTAGTPIWSQRAEGYGREWVYDIQVGASGAVLSGGSSSDTLRFGEQVLPTTSWSEPFVAALNPDGVWLWAKAVGTTSPGYGNAYASASLEEGSILVTGTSDGPMEFGGHPFTSTYSTGFLARLGEVSTAITGREPALLRVFHDPLANALVIEASAAQNGPIDVFDLLGTRVAHGMLREGEHQLALPELASGIYLVHVISGGAPLCMRVPVLR